METILNKNISELAIIESQIKRLESIVYPSDGVANHFYMGRVGGSGKNTARLNKQRERDLDRTIENSKKLTALYASKNILEAEIKRLEDGTWKPSEQIKQERKEQKLSLRKIEADQDKKQRASMSAKERLFIGRYPTGTLYADMAVTKNGDFKKLAFKSDNTGEVTWYVKRIPSDLRELIEQDVSKPV